MGVPKPWPATVRPANETVSDAVVPLTSPPTKVMPNGFDPTLLNVDEPIEEYGCADMPESAHVVQPPEASHMSELPVSRTMLYLTGGVPMETCV